MWGFMTVWNDILIPRFKEAFTLSYFQAMLVQFAFFGAYAVGALAYYLVSMLWGDPINRIGYKNGVIIGLLIAAGGSALFYPGGGARFVSVLPARPVHRRPRLRDAPDRGQSVRDDPRSGAHRVEPAQPVAGVQFVRHHDRADHRRLADLHRVHPPHMPWRRRREDPVPVLRARVRAAGRAFRVRAPARLHQRGAIRAAAGAPSNTRTRSSACWRSSCTSAARSRSAAPSSTFWARRGSAAPARGRQRFSGVLLGRPDDRPVHGRVCPERHARLAQARA